MLENSIFNPAVISYSMSIFIFNHLFFLCFQCERQGAVCIQAPFQAKIMNQFKQPKHHTSFIKQCSWHSLLFSYLLASKERCGFEGLL